MADGQLGLMVVLGPDVPDIDQPGVRRGLERYTELTAEAGGGVAVKWVDSSLPEDEVVAACRDAIAIVPEDGAFSTEMARRMPNLKLIQCLSAGTEWLDRGALAEMGVIVANNGGANAQAVAEHAIALMIIVYRQLDRQLRSVRAGQWMDGAHDSQDKFHTLVGKTVGIVGLGRIGSNVARRLAGWGCTEVVYNDILSFPSARERELGVRRVGLDELLAISDIVTLHVPLDRTTLRMISTPQFDAMKPAALLINTCRGRVVDEAALIEALRQGKIFGAGLDVTEVEPIPADSPLLDLPNVIVTPHLATRAIESWLEATRFAMDNIYRLARGEKLQSIVDPV